MKIGKDIIHLWLIYLTALALFFILVFSFYSVREIWEITSRKAHSLEENIFTKSASLNKALFAIHEFLHTSLKSDPGTIAHNVELARAILSHARLSVPALDQQLIDSTLNDDPLLIVPRIRRAQKRFDVKIRELTVLYSELTTSTDINEISDTLTGFENRSREMIEILNTHNHLLLQIGSHFHSNLGKDVKRLERYLTYLIVFFLILTMVLAKLVHLYTRSRKKLMDQLMVQRDLLELRVTERTSFNAKQNDVLQSEAIERKKAEEKLKSTLKEKEILLREIHHRVKNNMQVISSLLKLQANQSNDENIKAALSDSQNKVYAMAAVHESLYRSENLSEIEISAFVKKIAEFVFRSQVCDTGQVILDIKSEEFGIDSEAASPLGLIINELITNALKHAFPGGEKGTITIDIKKKQKNGVHILFKDDGVGIPDKADRHQQNGLGMQLIETLVNDQLEGSLNLTVAGGTQFDIKFQAMSN